ncbi:MAG: endospore germination permease [Syntrophomonadaceae bacterium]|nr:endospore germination permease [Syntrophomonadaceae bacterium]
MNDKTASMISSKQLIFIIIGAQIATGLFSLPRITAEKAGTDAWIAILLGAVFPLASIFLIERWARIRPDLGFVAMLQFTLGKPLGYLSGLIFVVYVVFLQSIAIRIFSEITSIYLLPRTPLPMIVFLVMTGVVYVANKGARVIGRLNELIFYILLILLGTLFFPLSEGDYTNLLPVGQAGWAAIGQASLATAIVFSGTEVLLVFYFLVTRKEEVLKAGFTAVGLTTGIYLMVSIIALLIYGADRLQSILWPGFTLLSIIQVPVVQRPDYFFLALWMVMGIRPTINMGFAAAFSLSELFNIDRSKYFHLLIIGIATAIYALALVPGNLFDAFQWSEYAGYLFLIIGLAFPLMLWLVALLRGTKVRVYI